MSPASLEPEKARPVTVDIVDCACCGGDHDGLMLFAFSRRPAIGNQELTHWGICPNVFDPILLSVPVQQA